MMRDIVLPWYTASARGCMFRTSKHGVRIAEVFLDHYTGCWCYWTIRGHDRASLFESKVAAMQEADKLLHENGEYLL